MTQKIQFWTTNRNPEKRVLVTIDAEDAALADRRWSAAWQRGRVRAILQSCSADGKHGQLLHRLMMQPPAGRLVDHADGNPANNRRANLRLCNHAENASNRRTQQNNACGMKGVCWHKGRKQWHAQIMVRGTRVKIGFFDDLQMAADAYRKAAETHHGEFTRTA